MARHKFNLTHFGETNVQHEVFWRSRHTINLKCSDETDVPSEELWPDTIHLKCFNETTVRPEELRWDTIHLKCSYETDVTSEEVWRDRSIWNVLTRQTLNQLYILKGQCETFHVRQTFNLVFWRPKRSAWNILARQTFSAKTAIHLEVFWWDRRSARHI